MPTSKVTVHFSCPVEQVWQTVTDLAYTAWRARVEVADEFSSCPSAAGCASNAFPHIHMLHSPTSRRASPGG